MNLMLLPLTLQVASSGTSIFLAMLLLEFELFFFRSCQHCHWMDIMSHVGFIVPLIMISSTVQGFQKAAEQKIARKGWLHALTAIFVTSGCALFAYTVLSLFIQQGECVAIVGDVATCACTRMYWSQGFLAPTNCTWEKIETFECHHATVMKDSQVYSQMLALQSANASDSMLTSIPRHVYLAANASSIDISGTKVCEVPWLGFESLKVVQSSPCVTKVNWSDMGLRDISFKRVETLVHLESVDFLHNNLLVILLLSTAPRLRFMDLTGNRIGGLIMHERIEYRMLGNPVESAVLYFDRRRMLDC